jgi:protein SCO1/2
MQKPDRVKTMTRRSQILVRWIVCFTITISVPVFAQVNSGLPREVDGVGVEQQLGAIIPGDLPFIDDRGRSVFLGQYFDGRRPVLLSLNYSDCPMLCSVQLNQLVMGLQNLSLEPEKDFLVLSVSINPKDDAEKARATKQKYVDQLRRPGMENAWHFLTGEPAAIRKLADTVGFKYRFDAKSGEFFHPAMLAYVSPSRVVSSYQLNVDYPATQLQLGLVDAADGKIGSLVANFPLLCFVYDEKKGSYVMSAYKIMRLGGATTVVILLAALIPYWRGKPRSKVYSELGVPSIQPSPVER